LDKYIAECSTTVAINIGWKKEKKINAMDWKAFISMLLNRETDV